MHFYAIFGEKQIRLNKFQEEIHQINYFQNFQFVILKVTFPGWNDLPLQYDTIRLSLNF